MTDRIVVLGAGGYLGRNIVNAAQRRGHEVLAAIRRPGTKGFERSGIVCDARDLQDLRGLLDGADYVIDATSALPRDMVAIAGNLADLLAQDAVGRVIYLSSLVVYGQTRGVLHEATMPKPASWHPYARAKLCAETKLSTAVSDTSRCIILRPGCIYGPAAPVWIDRIARLLQRQRLGWLGDAGQGTCHLVHVRDLATMIAALPGRPASGTYNLPGSEVLSWNQYFIQLAAAIGALPLRDVSKQALSLDVWLGGPVRRLSRSITHSELDSITPAMRRLFANRSRLSSIRAPLLVSEGLLSLHEGIAEAAATFLHPARPVFGRQADAMSTRPAAA